jgi:hypothetical protein
MFPTIRMRMQAMTKCLKRPVLLQVSALAATRAHKVYFRCLSAAVSLLSTRVTVQFSQEFRRSTSEICKFHSRAAGDQQNPCPMLQTGVQARAGGCTCRFYAVPVHVRFDASSVLSIVTIFAQMT